MTFTQSQFKEAVLFKKELRNLCVSQDQQWEEYTQI